jgi:hypothetical protein
MRERLLPNVVSRPRGCELYRQKLRNDTALQASISTVSRQASGYRGDTFSGC